MLRLCVRCGEEVPPGASCPRCGAPEPRWERADRSFRARVDGFFRWLAGTLGGLLCFVAVFALFAGWIGPGLGQRVLQVLVGIVVGGVGLPVGVVLIVASARSALDREWRHPALNGRVGAATTRLGRLLSASGGGRLEGGPIAVPPNELGATEAFAHYAVLRRALPLRYGLGNSPPRVDVALAAALLSLAGRGRVQIRVPRDVSWTHDGSAVARSEVAGIIEVRRADSATGAGEAGDVEALLLRAMAAPGRTVAPREASLPYRESAAVAGPVAEAPWARLRDVAAAVTGGDPGFRRAQRARMLSAVPPEAAMRPAQAVGAEFAAVVGATGDPALGATLVREIELGFAVRAG